MTPSAALPAGPQVFSCNPGAVGGLELVPGHYAMGKPQTIPVKFPDDPPVTGGIFTPSPFSVPYSLLNSDPCNVRAGGRGRCGRCRSRAAALVRLPSFSSSARSTISSASSPRYSWSPCSPSRNLRLFGRRRAGQKARQRFGHQPRIDRLAARAEVDQAAGHLLQLAHVARPALGAQLFDRLDRHPAHRAPGLAPEILQETAEQGRQAVEPRAAAAPAPRSRRGGSRDPRGSASSADRHAELGVRTPPPPARRPPPAVRRAGSPRAPAAPAAASPAALSGMSPISSRKRVPRSASRKRPRRALTPVATPWPMPNISASSSSAGIAAQFTATKFLSARGECWRRARARCSLPTPVSPRTKTGTGPGATSAIWR